MPERSYWISVISAAGALPRSEEEGQGGNVGGQAGK